MDTIINDAPAFNATPLYIQVARAVVVRIKAGVWKPGQAIPNETDLAREMTVSSGTMRKALDMVEADGLLVRKQGKGTFVREQPAWGDLSAEAKALLKAIGASMPSARIAARCIAGGADSYNSDELRGLARGAIEIAAWLDRRAMLEKRAA